MPIGPVAVFGASNFPLAFSVAGGDTASALAAGCPVVVRAHPGHPGTSELVAKAVLAAVVACNVPVGVFSLIQGQAHQIGAALVQHPAIRAVGFTGSLAGGRALCDLAARREVPIPVFAEMGSNNPVFLLPQALRHFGPQLAQGFVTSLTMATGQFCTNPGLVIGRQAPEFQDFTREVSKLVEATSAGVMLNAGILTGYQRQTAKYRAYAKPLAQVFGPCSLLLEVSSRCELLEVAEALAGQLTATVWAAPGELEAYRDLVAILEQKAGRVIINGFPTGVEVCDSMAHGGPYPACSDSRSTSVGTRAVERFLRPVCFQDYSDDCLPSPLKNANPLGLRRLINGTPSNQPVAA